MASVSVMDLTRYEPGYRAPHTEAHGDTSAAFAHPDGFALWSLRARLTAGAELVWGGDHGDEGLFVLSGRLRAGEEACGAGGAVVIEAGVPARVQADADTELVHVGPADADPPSGGIFGPAAPGACVHVTPADQGWVRSREGSPISSRLFADSTCPTCRITLFVVSGPAGYRAASHYHSEDEIIQVLEGGLQVGAAHIGPGMAVAIPGDQRYGFSSTADYRFLNYRRDVSTYTGAPGTDPILEVHPPAGVTTTFRTLPV